MVEEVRNVREKSPWKQERQKETMLKYLQVVIMGKVLMSPDETLAAVLSPNWTQTSHGHLSVKVSLQDKFHKEGLVIMIIKAELVVETGLVIDIILIVS